MDCFPSVSHPMCSTLSAERPGVCLDLSAGCADDKPSPAKLSKPQKRRRRMQVLAAHRGIPGIAPGPPEESFQTCVLNYLHSISMRLQHLETQALSPGTCLQRFNNDEDIVDFHSYLRADAPEFVSKRSAAICIQSWFRNWRCRAKVAHDIHNPAEHEDFDNVQVQSSMDEDVAARVVQSQYRNWRVHGPLGRGHHRRWQLSKALDFTGYEYLKSKVRASTSSSPDDFYDPQADIDAIKFQSACTIQSAWRSWQRDVDGPLDYVPVMFGYTQQDLDNFSKGCRSLLSTAQMMMHLISDTGDLQISEDVLAGIAQHFLDSMKSTEDVDYNWNAFPDCLTMPFGKPPKESFQDGVNGNHVRTYFRRFQIHEQIRVQQAGEGLDLDRCIIALSCLMHAAAGKTIPEDVPI